MSFFGDIGGFIGDFIPLPGADDVLGVIGDQFGGGDDRQSCPGQTPTDVARALLLELTPADRQYLRTAWATVSRTNFDNNDPWTLARQAVGGGGCVVDPGDRQWAAAWDAMVSKYAARINPVASAPVPSYPYGGSTPQAAPGAGEAVPAAARLGISPLLLVGGVGLAALLLLRK